MALTLTEEQLDFKSAVDDVLDSAGDTKRVREVQEAGAPFDDKLWKALVELGVPGILVSEDHDGLGLGLSEASIVLQALGAHISPTPYRGLAIATAVIAKSGDGALADEVLPKIADGSLLVVPAFAEGNGGWIPAAPSVTVSGGAVSGTKSFVLDGVAAQAFLVLATEGGTQGLYYVEAGDGVEVTKLDTLDRSTSAASVAFANAPARKVATADFGELLAYADAVASTVIAANLYGGFAKTLEIAVQYAKDRFQFGRPIGSFQGVKFPLAELAMEDELALSILRQATTAADEDPEDFVVAGLTALSKLQGIALEGAIRLVQTLGGIGFTWDHDAHLYQKQAATVRLVLGTPAERSERLAQALGI
ncbi:acyl-CoA dehydrogenase family protein [Gryllotalpicola koreensis]|uniref:Acyl-CoA dehydrogenase family protein n=1 Tax=Gryllotalpicola koreensis TaxID=993086 RepID=A0ABP7ZYQ5_9MICO